MEKLLQEEPDAAHAMETVEAIFEEAGLLSGTTSKHSVFHFVENAIAENPLLFEISVPWMMEHSADPESAETPEELANMFVPKEWD
ncbi:hypothetical protein QM467_18265 [Rhodoblastus sp. 17X3]|uniref:hypothetical protein n=1 Tax=Rhodoblastus sp. 17X3 TaxID=3047026 RepID=UPI0024B7E5E3|nr:hypothetical protein [Rhodoblastus sp. 17X3]MDI9849987.1 hypothetical protein [Rhodoblastus sp. 17X3]